MTVSPDAPCEHHWEFMAIRRGEHLCIEQCAFCEEVRRFEEWFPKVGERFYARARPSFETPQSKLWGPFVYHGPRPDVPDVVVGYPPEGGLGSPFDPYQYTFSPELPL